MNTQKKPIKASLIADYFIDKANKENKAITNKKLQKLLYYSQAWCLVLKNKKLYNEEIEAWVHGPAIKSIYIKYKTFGFNPIITEISPTSIKEIPAETKKLLDDIWTIYGKFDAEYLEMLTHSEKPWIEAREGLQASESSENKISLTTMRDFYSNKLKSSK